jgi:hypothetical protein
VNTFEKKSENSHQNALKTKNEIYTDIHAKETILQHIFSYLWTYDLYGPVHNAFDAGRYITRASGRGLCPGKRNFLGSVKASSR